MSRKQAERNSHGCWIVGTAAAVAAITTAWLPAAAQTHLTKVVRVVQTKAGAAQTWNDVSKKLPTAIQDGDNVRTQVRSLASLLFRDRSTLDLDQFTQVVVRGASQRDIEFLNQSGRVKGDFRGPGVIHGPHGSAAWAGTRFEFEVSGDTTRITCYDGIVFAAGRGGNIRAGKASSGTASTLLDASLIGQTQPWAGATIRIASGPDQGQQRAVQAFDATTGAVTFDRALANPVAPGIYYVLTTQPNLAIVELKSGTQTTVKAGQSPSAPRTAFPIEFAHGEERSWFAELDALPEGGSLAVFPGTQDHQNQQEANWPLQDDGALIGDPSGSLRHSHYESNPYTYDTIGPDGGRSKSDRHSGSLTATRAFGENRTANSDGFSMSSGLASLLNSLSESGAANTRHRTGVTWDLLPYGLGADDPGGDAWAGGLRGRFRVVAPSVMVEVGGHISHFAHGSGLSETLPFDPDTDRYDLTEASLLYRSARWGDLKIGRQHLFLGPVNNGRFGTLLTNTSDGFIWKSPARHGFQVQAGYLIDVLPLLQETFFDSSFKGWMGRAEAALFGGRIGATVLTAENVNGGAGYSMDLSMPLFPHQMDTYLEWGRDPFGRTLFTTGFYLPGLSRKTRLDLWVEYQVFDAYSDRVSARVQYPAGSQWYVNGYYVRQLDGGTEGGLGIAYRLR